MVAAMPPWLRQTYPVADAVTAFSLVDREVAVVLERIVAAVAALQSPVPADAVHHRALPVVPRLVQLVAATQSLAATLVVAVPWQGDAVQRLPQHQSRRRQLVAFGFQAL